jgi:hypothetical protein
MFSLPKPSLANNRQTDSEQHKLKYHDSESDALVDITENAETMRQLLSLIYPCESDIDITNLTLSRQVYLLATSRKYMFDVITTKLASTLAHRAEQNPQEAFTIFAIGSALYLPEIIQRASLACLQSQIVELQVMFPSESGCTTSQEQPTRAPESDPLEQIVLENLTQQFKSVDYQRLLKFHRNRTRQAVEIAKTYDPKPLAHIEPHTYKASSARCTCFYQFGASVSKLLVEELENKGPVLRNLLNRDFMRDIRTVPCEK